MIKAVHPWSVSIREAIIIQEQLREKLNTSPAFDGIVTLVAGADVGYSYTEDMMYAGVVVFTYPELKLVESAIIERKIEFPYIPTLLSFREGPCFIAAFEKLHTEPDVIIFDGQGIAHPRRLGIAAHLGILLDKPTIGCAKSLLYGKIVSKVSETRGSVSFLVEENNEKEIIGAAVRTKDKVKPIIISPGYKMNLENAIKITLTCTKKYRLPEPIRYAHQLVTKFKT